MSAVLNVLNLEMSDQSGPTAVVAPPVSVPSGSSSGSQNAQSSIMFVQELVNEMTASVLQSAAVAAVVASNTGGSSGTSSAGAGTSSGSEDSNNSNGPSNSPQNSSPKRPLEKDSTNSGKSSKRSKKSKENAAAAAAANAPSGKLEIRLGGILCCAVCLDLPKSSVYQCTNGHLMCAGCFTHLLADARIRDETATCPNCRCVISKDQCSRNLAVEKAVCELPGECRFCNQELPRSLLDRHMSDVCEERMVSCRYVSIGCPWNGPFHEADFHAESCQHPDKSGKQVLSYLQTQEKSAREDKKLFDSLFNLLSFEKITLNDLQFRPFRTDEYIHKLFYETSRFSAFNLQWVVKSRVNDDQRDPTQSVDRHLSFQLGLKSKISNPMTIHYMILKGPFGDMKALPKLFKHDFTETSLESTFNRINLVSSAECNRLLASKVINFRLIMFQASK